MRVTRVSISYAETRSIPGQFGNVRAEVRMEADLEGVESPEPATDALFGKARVEVMRQIDKGLRAGGQFPPNDD